MYNEKYSLNHLYSLVRDYYVDSFPHRLIFNGAECINLHLSRNKSTATIDKVGDNYLFTNNTPMERSDNIFSEGSESYVIDIEGFLESEDNRVSLIKDINKLESWMQESGFVRNGVATEKLLDTHKII